MPRHADTPAAWVMGQALLESALILPFVLLLTLAVFEFSRLLAIYSLTSGAARQATRYGTAVDNNGATQYYLDCDGIRQIAKSNAAPLMALADDQITIEYDNGQDLLPLGSPEPCGSISDDELEDGDRIRVTVTALYQPIVPLVNLPPLPITYVSTRTLIKSISTFPQCSDGIDNDGDGLVDLDDPNCANVNDNTEAAPPGAPDCWGLEISVSPSESVGHVDADPIESCEIGDEGYADSDNVTLTAVLTDTNYTFSNWSGDASGADNPVTIAMESSKSVTANFVACYNLTVTVTPNDPALGEVPIPSPNCSDGIKHTGTITLTASAFPGAGFSEWQGDASGTNPVLSVTMDADKTITAVFTDVCYVLDLDPPVGGTASIESPNCNEGTEYAEGTVVGLIADPDVGWAFDEWSGANDNFQQSTTVTMTGDKTIGVTFQETCYAVDVIVLPDTSWGSVSSAPDCESEPGKFRASQTVQLMANPEPGHLFFRWSGDALGTANPVTILVNGDKSVTAHFEGQLHVSRIDIYKINAHGNNWYAQVVVTVVDDADAPVSGVVVTGVWTNDGNSWSNDPVNAPNTTNSFGQVTFNSATDSCKVSNTCTFEYRVTHLALINYSYDSDANVVTSASILAP